MRDSGILLHISSLPGKGGCGTMGAEARRFVEYLRAAGQGCWQVLPLTPPARGNSPYSSYSVFAGNPYLIDLQALVDENLLPAHALRFLPDGTDKADFGWCGATQMNLLRESFAFAGRKLRSAVERFSVRNSFWLPDYALFMTLKTSLSGSFHDWPEPLLMRDRKTIRGAMAEHADEIAFWEYTQFIFFSQWRALKRYANTRGIKLIGDMPIYADMESADVWANPDVFALDYDLNPSMIAGVPPDAFSEDGQLWGNPLYDWKYLRRTKYRWWVERLKNASALYDSVRIDHFRAIANYFAIPAGATSAKDGEWQKGPGMDFIRVMRKAAPDCGLIAEDLGLLDEGVRRLLKHSGLPGMKVLLFAFSTKEESDYLPHNFIKNCVGYIGTHDNDTVRGWFDSAPNDEANFARRYFNIQDDAFTHRQFIRWLMATSADRVIIQMQDVLGLDGKARMNMPGIADGNWSWRLLPGQLTPETARYLKEFSKTYCREPKVQENKQSVLAQDI